MESEERGSALRAGEQPRPSPGLTVGWRLQQGGCADKAPVGGARCGCRVEIGFGFSSAACGDWKPSERRPPSARSGVAGKVAFPVSNVDSAWSPRHSVHWGLSSPAQFFCGFGGLWTGIPACLPFRACACSAARWGHSCIQPCPCPLFASVWVHLTLITQSGDGASCDDYTPKHQVHDTVKDLSPTMSSVS